VIEAALTTMLKTTLASTAGARVYPLRSPEPAVAPLCIYQALGSDVVHYMDDASDVLVTRMQVDVYSKTAAEAASMAKAVRQAMKSWNVPISYFVEDAGTALLEDTVEPNLYRVSMRFILTHEDA
jgi:hypothetical protein